MHHRRGSAQSFSDLPSARRRRLVGALGVLAAGASLGGCASPPPASPRPVDRAAAPRAGDTWTYRYSSVFRSVPPRMLEVRLLEVGGAGLRDRMAIAGEAGEESRAFTSALELAERPLGGLTVYELSPYLQAFGALPAEGALAAPPPAWGPPFAGRARLRGPERIALPAGSFDATRIDFELARPRGGTLQPRSDPVFTLGTVWYAPAAKRAVQWTLTTRAGALNILVEDTCRLEAYRPS
jgi:hypothetical protein